MKPIYCVQGQPTDEQITSVRLSNPSLADLMAKGIPEARYRTKRSADKCAADFAANGWIVTRRTLLCAESLEEAFMHIMEAA